MLTSWSAMGNCIAIDKDAKLTSNYCFGKHSMAHHIIRQKKQKDQQYLRKIPLRGQVNLTTSLRYRESVLNLVCGVAILCCSEYVCTNDNKDQLVQHLSFLLDK